MVFFNTIPIVFILVDPLSFLCLISLLFLSFFFFFTLASAVPFISLFRFNRAVLLLNPWFRVSRLWSRANSQNKNPSSGPVTVKSVLWRKRNNPRQGWRAIQFSFQSDLGLKWMFMGLKLCRQPATHILHVNHSEGRGVDDVFMSLSLMEAGSRRKLILT